MLDPTRPVADLVLENSACAQVLTRHRIDFCCRGAQTLEQAAQAKQVELAALVAELVDAIAKRGGDSSADLRQLSTPDLISHIVAKHHGYLRDALPFVQTLAAKVSRVHGDHNPKLRDLHATVEELAATLLPHLDDEEETLFPALVASEASAAPQAAQNAKLLAEMVEEHEAVGALLARARAASDDYTAPDWACNSYRTLLTELEDLESDTFLHVQLENHVLLPRHSAR